MASQNSKGISSKINAPKDRICPFCHRAFTASSLGRHLDLYIREKSSKPPDSLHDVEAIRRLRSGVTRRVRAASCGSKESTPAEILTSALNDEDLKQDDDLKGSSAHVNKSMHAANPVNSDYRYVPRWELNGVLTDVSAWSSVDTDHPLNQAPGADILAESSNPDLKSKFTHALDTARAAELALREIVSSWRASK